jgi:hypothetical protein
MPSEKKAKTGAERQAAYRDRERSKAGVAKRVPPSEQACGSESKARWHRRMGEELDDGCRAAERRAMNARRLSKTDGDIG